MQQSDRIKLWQSIRKIFKGLYNQDPEFKIYLDIIDYIIERNLVSFQPMLSLTRLVIAKHDPICGSKENKLILSWMGEFLDITFLDAKGNKRYSHKVSLISSEEFLIEFEHRLNEL